MCGLCGYITHKDAKLTPKQLKQREGILKGLMLAMQERGTHSTGIGVIVPDKKEEKFCIYKRALSAKQLTETDDFDTVMKWKPRVVLAHTRFATIGAITDNNAHPFKEGTIMGTHNGHVTNWRSICDEEAEVDSQAIFQALNEAENDFKTALKRLDGAFAITWIDLRDTSKLYLVKQTNPLYLIKVNELQTYFWASTQLALESVIGTIFDMKDKSIWTPKYEHVYEFSDNLQITKTSVDFAPKIYSNYHGTGYYSGYKSSNQYDNVDFKKSEESKQDDSTYQTTDTDEEDDYNEAFEQGKLVENHDSVLAYYDKKDVQVIENALVEQCCYCGQDFDIASDSVFYWIETSRAAICMTCGDEEDLWDEALVFSFEALLDRMTELDYEEQLAGYKRLLPDGKGGVVSE